MRRLKRHPKLRTYLYRLTTSVLLAVVVTGGVGVPLVSFVAKDKSQPFPCQDSPCACRDAEACWRDCCCLNDEEKLAWAADAGVQPPDFVLERLSQLAPAATVASTATAPSETCGSCCQSAPANSPTSPDAPVAASEEDVDSEFRLVLLSAQSSCQGYIDWLTLLSTALFVDSDPAEDLNPELSQPVSIVAGLYQTCERHPPVPPPRLG